MEASTPTSEISPLYKREIPHDRAGGLAPTRRAEAWQHKRL